MRWLVVLSLLIALDSRVIRLLTLVNALKRFETRLLAYAMRFHTGQLKVRIFSVYKNVQYVR